MKIDKRYTDYIQLDDISEQIVQYLRLKELYVAAIISKSFNRAASKILSMMDGSKWIYINLEWKSGAKKYPLYVQIQRNSQQVIKKFRDILKYAIIAFSDPCTKPDINCDSIIGMFSDISYYIGTDIQVINLYKRNSNVTIGGNIIGVMRGTDDDNGGLRDVVCMAGKRGCWISGYDDVEWPRGQCMDDIIKYALNGRKKPHSGNDISIPLRLC